MQSPQVGHSEKQRLRGVIAAEEAGSRSWAALRPLTTPPEPRHPGQQAKPEQLESYAREAREFLERLAWVEGQNAGRLQLALSLRATLLELGEDEYAEVYSQKIREMYGLRNLPTDRGIIRRVASAATQWVSLRRKHGAVG